MELKIANNLDTNIWTISHTEKIEDIDLGEMELIIEKKNKNLYINLNKDKNINKSFYFDKILKNKFLDLESIQINLNTLNKIEDIEFINHFLFSLYGRQVNYKSNYKFINLKVIFVKANITKTENEFIINNFNSFKSKELAKYLSDTDPSGKGSPENLAEYIKELFINKNVKVNIMNLEGIKKNNLSLIEAVNKGSHLEPRFIVIEYNGNLQSKEKIVLIGKGVTFDSGGYSLKTADGMKTMRLDKCGACNVISILDYVVNAKLNLNISIITPFTENSIGGGAIFPGQVIKTLTGKTVQIDNTDAEGRLVLADALSYAVLNLKPTEIIEMSTLTGAITIALGKYMTGCFTNDYKYANNFKIASDEAGDEIWIMPIHQKNIEMIKSAELADISNSPQKSKHGGPSQAAAFLNEFVPKNIKFIHLDLGGTAVDNNRATGAIVRGVINYLNIKNGQFHKN